MKQKNLYSSVIIAIFSLSRFKGIAQRDSLLAMAGNPRINRSVDSLAKIFDKENNTFLLFIHVDYLEQKAYGCIVSKRGDSIVAKKLLIDSNYVSERKVEADLILKNRRILLDFFNNTQAYLLPSFSDESNNKLDHDSRTFFIAKSNGKILYRGCFYISDYTDSKNTKMINFFLKLTGMMTWFFDDY